MSNIKYLHIMTHPAKFFNENIIKMINENKNDFKANEHIFLVGYEDIYMENKKYKNVIYIPKIMTKNYKKFIEYCNDSKYVFLHQNWFYDYIRLIFTPIKIRKKYVWCVWGHDLYTDLGKIKGVKERVKLIARKIGNILINFEVKYYKGIGIGFKYDSLEIKKRFKDKTKIFTCPYPVGITFEKINKIIQQKNTSENKLNIKIMVAHSAHEYLNHKEILKKLSEYKNERIIISLPLVYGDMKYAKEIEKYAKDIFADKVEIIKSRMSTEEYIKYLNGVDIAILDQIHQSGLGNLFYLLLMNKKIYVNKDGILKLSFLLEGSNFCTTDNIGVESFKDFISKNNNQDNAKLYAEYIMSDINQKRMWKETFDLLK